MSRRRGAVPGDVVLIHLEGKPASFARLEDVRAHQRPGWYFCDLLVLGVPLQAITWILEREQIDGAEFTMGGRLVRIERMPDMGAVHASSPGASPGEIAEREAAPPPPPPPSVAPGAGSGSAASQPGASAKPDDVRQPRQSKVVRLFPRDS